MSTSWVVDDLVDDAAELFDGPLDDLVAVLEEIASLGDVEAPTPSAELALLLAGRPAAPHRPVRHRRRVAPALGGLAAAAVAGLTLTGTAAYANELPPSVQRVVAHLSEDYLPFTFPRPVGDPPAPDPAVTAGRSGCPVLRRRGPQHRPVGGRRVRSRAGRSLGRWPHRPGRRAPAPPGRAQARAGPPVRGAPARAAPVRRRTVRGVDGRGGPHRGGDDDTGRALPAGLGGDRRPHHPDRGADRRPAGCTERSDERAGRSLPVNGSVTRPDARPVVRPGQPAAHDAVLRRRSRRRRRAPGRPPMPARPRPAGRRPSQSPGPEPTPVTGTATTPPASPSDPGGSQPAGPGSRSPDTAASSPAVGSGGSPAADVVTDPGTAGSAAPTTPVP